MHTHPESTTVSATFTELGHGAYEARVASTRHGLWELRLDAKRAQDRFTPTLRVDVTP